MSASRHAADRLRMLRRRACRLVGLGAIALLVACASAQAAIVRAATLPDVQIQPPQPTQAIRAPAPQAPAIQLPQGAPPGGPAADS